MTKVKEKLRAVEDVERDLAEVRGRLEEMRAELREVQNRPAPSWDSVGPGTVEDLADAERRRSALPQLVEAGEVREAELDLERTRLLLPATGKEIEAAYEDLQCQEEELKKAQKKRDAAYWRWTEAIERQQDLRGEERRLLREVAERKAAASHSRERLAAPVVRSLWQQGSRA